VLGQLLADYETPSNPNFFALVANQITAPLGMGATEAEPLNGTPT
jgi:hypothetical protein